MNEPDMLVVKLLWFFGFLLFTKRSTAQSPTESPSDAVNLTKGLADKYGKLLGTIVAVNMERIDTMKKLYALQDTPIRSYMRSMDMEEYGVWKVEKKPAWLKALSEGNNIEYDDILQTFIYDKTMTFATKDLVRLKSSSKFWRGNKSLSDEESDEERSNVNFSPINKHGNNVESGSLEFWEGNEGLLDEDIRSKDGKTKDFKKQEPIEQSNIYVASNSLDLINEKLIDDVNSKYNSIVTNEKTLKQIYKIKKKISSFEFWKGYKEILLNKDLSREEHLNNKLKKFFNNKITVIIPLFIKNSSANRNLLESFRFLEDISDEYTNKEFLDENIFTNMGSVINSELIPIRRHNKRKKGNKFVKSCSRHSVRYCKTACMDAFEDMCKSFKCTSFVKRRSRKECRYACKDQFKRRAYSSEKEDTYETYEKESTFHSKDSGLFSWKKKPKHGQNSPALSSATFWRQ